MTFSVVGFDRGTGDLGIAVASKFLAVGAVVPWAQAGVGAVATQSYADTSFGPRGLDLLRGGHEPSQVVDALTRGDADKGLRQVGVVDAQGRSATFTGESCHAWAGGHTGRGFACQGNILAGPEVVQALAAAYEQATGDLAERLIYALSAGQAAGGDRRGQQSAALLIVRSGGGYGGRNDRYVDLRVDDHRTPVDELRRLLQLWRVYFQTPDVNSVMAWTAELTAEVQTLLARTGTYTPSPDGVWDDASARALRTWAGVENLEERLRPDGIDPIVLRMLRERHAQ